MSNLARQREAAGLTQGQLAIKSGVPLRMIQAYECSGAGHRDINKAQALRVWKLANALGCKLGDILELEEAGA